MSLCNTIKNTRIPHERNLKCGQLLGRQGPGPRLGCQGPGQGQGLESGFGNVVHKKL